MERLRGPVADDDRGCEVYGHQQLVREYALRVSRRQPAYAIRLTMRSQTAAATSAFGREEISAAAPRAS
ncbi:hypothetical protein GCM10010201_27280 [Pilimelia columellifera subsp. columellifera]|uniref:Uncharacterized protein n=1 Tax=Pilimelia columellifera subsp. columellifera TaxID=706583 RepID=A0ABP6AXF5_9ACTN